MVLLWADGDMRAVLTPSQVSEIKKLLERQHQAAAAVASAASVTTSISDESRCVTQQPHQTSV